MTDPRDITTKLRNIISVSTRVRQDQLRTALGIDPAEFDRRIFEWAEEFGFKIDGDYVNFTGTDVDGFIHSLDAEFAAWKGPEMTGAGKASLPQTSPIKEFRQVPKETSSHVTPNLSPNKSPAGDNRKRIIIAIGVVIAFFVLFFLVLPSP